MSLENSISELTNKIQELIDRIDFLYKDGDEKKVVTKKLEDRSAFSEDDDEDDKEVQKIIQKSTELLKAPFTNQDGLNEYLKEYFTRSSTNHDEIRNTMVERNLLPISKITPDRYDELYTLLEGRK